MVKVVSNESIVLISAATAQSLGTSQDFFKRTYTKKM